MPRITSSRPRSTSSGQALRDFSSLEFLPRTASWAKFSRPSGTHFAIGRFARTHFSPCGTSFPDDLSADLLRGYRTAMILLLRVPPRAYLSSLFSRAATVLPKTRFSNLDGKESLDEGNGFSRAENALITRRPLRYAFVLPIRANQPFSASSNQFTTQHDRKAVPQGLKPSPGS